MKSFSLIIRIGVFFLIAFSCSREEGLIQSEKKLFEKMLPGETGIDFSNRITVDPDFNVMNYEYIYNGGGTAVGDFNNDGLQDLFFTGNMVNNAMYLNQGDFRFRNITELAGIQGADRWCTGSSVIDINNDGWLDLYICTSTYEPYERRTNLLFVNQGVNEDQIPLFEEMADAYGLADTTHCTMAAFFDYDRDGDLDMFLAVNNIDPRIHPNAYKEKDDIQLTYNADRLYENNFDGNKGHPVFTDVSEASGLITGGYALGLNIVDINRDGWKDVYVSNDYLAIDHLYMNNGDKTFTDRSSEYLKHTSMSAMGMDVADVNNDGLADIFVLDMLPEYNVRRKTMVKTNNYFAYIQNEKFDYPYQYVRNMLQLNRGVRPDNGELIFSEIGMFAGIHATDWSWTPLLADFDQDGYRDLLISNGFPRDITDHDFAQLMRDSGNLLPFEKLLEQIPSVKLHNYAYRNDLDVPGGIPSYTNVSEEWGLKESSFSMGAVYADLDNDGDLDYILNNMDDSAFVYKNTLADQGQGDANWIYMDFVGSSKNVNGLGAIVEVYHDGQHQMWEHTPYRGYLSSVQMGVHFGLGESELLDSVRIAWAEGKLELLYNIPVNQKLVLDFKDAHPGEMQQSFHPQPYFRDITEDAGIDFIHPEMDYNDFSVQKLLLRKLSQFGPGIAVSDINNDGLDDFYVGGSHFNKGRFFVQQRNGKFRELDLLPGVEGRSKMEEELGVLFFDADNDQDEDLYLVSGGYEFDISSRSYQDRLFFNENGTFRMAKAALPDFASSGSCVRAADFDRDGDLDLFVGGRVHPSFYPLAVSSYLLINNGEGKFTNATETHARVLDRIGLISDALWTDYNNDGWVDLLIAGEWMPLRILKNTSGRLNTLIPLNESAGWWNSLASGDFDMDGDMDYVAGNLGSNTLIRTGKEYPVRLFAGDFNNDQMLDLIPSNYYLNEHGEMEEFPYYGRMDMEKQIEEVKDAFTAHHEFGRATMDEVLSRLSDVQKILLKANCQKTSYFENMGNGEFVQKELAAETQLAPVYALLTGDFTGDQFPDILLTGNDYGNEVGIGRYDALNGLLLKGDGQGNFSPLSMQKSGIVFPGDGKSLVTLKASDGSLLVASGQNRGKLGLFRHEDQIFSMDVGPFDHAAIIHLKNKQSYRHEIYYGNSFLSQSSRRLWLPVNTDKVEIIDYRGSQREVVIPQ
jgi:hypothetical protein